MSRAELIGSICSVVNSNQYSDQQRADAKALLENVTARRITEEVAASRYEAILSTAPQSYWIDKLKPKMVYESLKKYRAHELDQLGTAKMVSSLITHGLIEIQKDSSASVDALGLRELSECLSLLMSSHLNEDISPQLDDILHKYGYLRKEGE